MNKTELAELARKAGFEVSEITGAIRSPSPLCGTELKRFAKLVAAAEPVQEPVAWMYTGIKQDGTTHGPHLVWKPAYMDAMSASKRAKATPLYTAPPQRKPLTDEELDALAIDEDGLPNSHLEFARAIERAHGIGEKK